MYEEDEVEIPIYLINRISGEWKNLFYQFYRSTGLFPDRRTDPSDHNRRR